MNLAAAEKIAKAVLYEGYMLYPYRPSSVKNKQRWNFGVLYPQLYAEAQGGSDPFWCQTECLLRSGFKGRVEIRVRFLHLVVRRVGRLKNPVTVWEEGSLPEFHVVDKLSIRGQSLQPWEEVEEREVVLALDREGLLSGKIHPFVFSGATRVEPVRDETGAFTGIVLRTSETLTGVIQVSSEQINDVLKLKVRVTNTASFSQKNRDEALKLALLSAHVILGGGDSEFVSLLEPPEELSHLAATCQNIGIWPVLVGEAGKRDTMLSSPIILYDYPQIAPESAGDLFDGTEIDEILSLRIMTMTEQEKREMRESDERARQILERTEGLPEEQLMKLHGVIRSMRPLKEEAS